MFFIIIVNSHITRFLAKIENVARIKLRFYIYSKNVAKIARIKLRFMIIKALKEN